MTAARPTIQPMSARRLSRTVLRIRLDMAVALLLVVVAQERSFQVRLAADQVDDRVPGRRFDQRVEPAVDGAAQDGAGDLQVLDAGQPAEVGLGYRCLEVDLDVAHRTLAEGLHPLDRDQVPVADDADPVGRVLHLGQHVRGHEDGLAGGPGLAYQLLELLLHERVQAAGRLVEDEQLRVVHERLYQADLLLVPLGQGADLPGGVQLEPLGQVGRSAPCPRGTSRRSAWYRRSCTTRSCSSSTSRPAAWTRSCSRSSRSWYARPGPPARPSSCPRTCGPRCSTRPTGSASSATGTWSRSSGWSPSASVRCATSRSTSRHRYPRPTSAGWPASRTCRSPAPSCAAPSTAGSTR